MIITYVAPNGDPLLTRPQTAPPGLGHRVTVISETGGPRFYRVACVEWSLDLHTPPMAWYALTDEALVVVRVLLKEEDHDG
jgi:hypothetical protein